jgi:GxxExxY protein
MNTNATEIIHKELSYRIVGLAMEVHTKLGRGFLEKVYENALMELLNRDSIPARQQAPIHVTFEGKTVGEFFADILVDKKIVLELKVAEAIGSAHKAQMINYLRGTGIRLGIILNFGRRSLEYARVVL